MDREVGLAPLQAFHGGVCSLGLYMVCWDISDSLRGSGECVPTKA